MAKILSVRGGQFGICDAADLLSLQTVSHAGHARVSVKVVCSCYRLKTSFCLNIDCSDQAGLLASRRDESPGRAPALGLWKHWASEAQHTAILRGGLTPGR